MIDLPRLGFGAAAIAQPAADALPTLEAAWESGMRYYDTAPMYGSGRSELLVGSALRSRPRNQFRLSTKVGRLVDRPGESWRYDFSRNGVLRSLDESRQRLGIDRFDLVLIHDPDDHWEQALTEAWPALASLRDQGVIGAVGVGMTQAPMLARFIREADLDVVLAAGVYTLLDTQAIDDLLPAATARGVSVIAAQSLHGGLIDGVTNAQFRYQPVDAVIRARVARIAAVCHAYGVPTAAVALQFPWAHPAVACVLSGPSSPAQLSENLAWAGLPIPAGVWADLRSEGLLPAEVPVPV